jgi:2,5-diketo-D-gluconate reductase B
VLREVAEERDATVAQVCLAWAHAQETVVPIPKGTGEHVAENYAALDLELRESELERIDGIDRRQRIVEPDDPPWE